MNKIGFLFDLDGVIIDSESEYTKIWTIINSEFPTGVTNLAQVIKGTTLEKILNEYYPDPEESRLVSERLHFLETQMEYKYLPGAEEFLDSLPDRDIPCALVTSSDKNKMIHLKEELPDLCDKFDFIVTANLVKTSKPSPEGYLLAAEKISVSSRNCAVFEDSLQGVMAGKESGAFVVGIRGTFPNSSLSPFCDMIVDNLGEIDIENLIKVLNER